MIIDSRIRLPEQLRPALQQPDELSERYEEVLELRSRSTLGVDELRAQMTQCGIAKGLVHAEYEHGDPADELNRAVDTLVRKGGGLFAGVGTISQQGPIDVMRALSQVDDCAGFGFAGVSVQPAFFHTAINDKTLYPVYARCAERGLVVFVHTGINYGSSHPFGNDHPMFLDEIACAIRGIKLVACHAGWPWTAEMVAVARKHPNVYLEFGGLSPKYIAAPGSGWEIMHRFLNSVLQDQILFGTDWPAFDAVRALEEWRAMDLKPEVLDKLLCGNAAKLFEIGSE